MTAPAKYRPSALSRLMQCAGSYYLAQHYPDESGPAAIEGTAAHWVAANLLQTGELVAVGSRTPEGVEVTQEMVDGAKMYADHVGPGAAVEQPVSCTSIHPELHGTADACRLGNGGLDVWDYKFGHGFVDEYENWQLVAYAAGIAGEVGLQPGTTPVRLHIVQPRAYHRRGPIRTWSLTVAELERYAARIGGRLDYIDARTPETIETRAGPHCRHCPARAGCETLQREAQAAVAHVGNAVPLDLPPEAAAMELALMQRSAELLAERISGLEAQVEGALRAGRRVPGYALVNKAGRERWSATSDEVLAIGQLLGVDLQRPVEPVTPSQARKLVPVPAMLDGLTERPSAQVLSVVDEKELRRVFSA